MFQLQAGRFVVAVIRPRHRRVHCAYIVPIVQIPQRLGHYLRYGVFANEIVQRDDLICQIKRQVRRILQENRAHNDLDGILILNRNQVQPIGSRMHSGAKRVLNDLDIFPAEKKPGQLILFPNPVQSVAKRYRLVDRDSIEHCKLLFRGRGNDDVHTAIVAIAATLLIKLYTQLIFDFLFICIVYYLFLNKK